MKLDELTSVDLPKQPSHIITVPENQERTRLDKFLSDHIKSVTRSQLQKIITEKAVLVNELPVRSSYLISPGDIIKVFRFPKSENLLVGENIPIQIVYEDNDVLVVNKAAGMVVHPAYGNTTGTLVNALLFHCQNIEMVGDTDRPGIVHRLDKDTSGLLVVAKNEYAHRHLANQFKERTISREYQAIVWGHITQPQKRIISHIKRSSRDRTRMISADDGKEAITNYAVLKQYQLAALLTIKLETGRTHQIRVHLSADGHPVVGDPTYYGRNKQLIGLNHTERQYGIGMLKRISRQALHAKKIGFTHPTTSHFLEFDSDLPDDMQNLLDFLENLEASLH